MTKPGFQENSILFSNLLFFISADLLIVNIQKTVISHIKCFFYLPNKSFMCLVREKSCSYRVQTSQKMFIRPLSVTSVLNKCRFPYLTAVIMQKKRVFSHFLNLHTFNSIPLQLSNSLLCQLSNLLTLQLTSSQTHVLTYSPTHQLSQLSAGPLLARLFETSLENICWWVIVIRCESLTTFLIHFDYLLRWNFAGIDFRCDYILSLSKIKAPRIAYI